MDNSYGLADLHEQLLIIMDDIDRVCKTHDIKYTISDGTLLGAVRHHGFIPWDDDMDVRMLRDDFEKFKTVYEKEKKAGFIIGHPCNLTTYSVINPQYVISGAKLKEGTINNPWISVFPMDSAPESIRMSNIKATGMRLLSGMIGKPPQYAYFSKKTRIKYAVTSFLGRIYGPERARKAFEKRSTSCKDSGSGMVVSYATNDAKTPYIRYPLKWFENIRDFDFEGRTYYGLADYDEYLTAVYGADYMTPLPPDQRKTKHIRMQSEDEE